MEKDPKPYYGGRRTKKSRKLEGERRPAIWVIDSGTYQIEKSSDKLPVFSQNGYSYKAAVAGSGSIAWYIRCCESSSASPCPVQGVRRKDGRLLMLRLHNHPPAKMSTPPKRSRRILEMSLRPRSASTQTSRRLNTGLPDETMTKRNIKQPETSRKSLSSVSGKAVSGTGLEASSLLSTVQRRWRAARRKSVITQLRSTVDTA